VSETLQAAKVLAPEATLGCLQLNVARVRHRFVVGVLGGVPPAVSIDDAGEAVLIRGPVREAADPACLGAVARPHDGKCRSLFLAGLNRSRSTPGRFRGNAGGPAQHADN
jgi:hypothetical protein